MQLNNILSHLEEQALESNIEINQISFNSRQVKPGCLFIALPGTQQDGRNFIQQALEQGASAVLAEKKDLHSFLQAIHQPDTQPYCPIIGIAKLNTKLGDIAKLFYATEQTNCHLVGFTGTNGKTTCSFLLAQALTRLHCSSAVMGTMGYGRVSEPLKKQTLTTPDVLTIHRQIKELCDQAIHVCALEASSHGLAQGRLDGLTFQSAVFTNLTQDHLDYHDDMSTYLKAKLRLFQWPTLKRAIINYDTEYFSKVVSTVASDCQVYVYALQKPDLRRHHYPVNTQFIYCKKYQCKHSGLYAVVETPWGEGELRSNLLGDFNLSNLLAVLTEICALGYSLDKALLALSHAQGAPGRMQRIGRGDLPEVIIDYAHTPDALEKALQASRQHCKRRLWCVFGCGGGRDKQKRQQMGAIAAQYADKVIITNDNPRLEPPQQIIHDIMQGIALSDSKKVVVEPDRKQAIQYAIAHALAVDTILVAGKGHERDQDLGSHKVAFSDMECVQTIFSQGVSP